MTVSIDRLETMGVARRTVIAGAAAVGLVAGTRASAAEPAQGQLYGLIGKFVAKPGQRDALIAAILEAGAMPGCLSFIVAADAKDADTVWITEVWDSKASHDASVSLPAVKASMAKGRPLIASFEPGAETRPAGGIGLVRG